MPRCFAMRVCSARDTSTQKSFGLPVQQWPQPVHSNRNSARRVMGLVERKAESIEKYAAPDTARMALYFFRVLRLACTPVAARCVVSKAIEYTIIRLQRFHGEHL